MNNFLLDIIKEFATEKIDFVVCGGIACVLQGCERTTFDIDLNVYLEKKNIKKTIKLLNKLSFSSRIPEPIESLLDEEKRNLWVNQKNAIVYTVISNDGLIQIDIFLDYPIPFIDLKKHANLFSIDNIEFYVSSKLDLISAKQKVRPIREKDIHDIKSLELLVEKEKRQKHQ